MEPSRSPPGAAASARLQRPQASPVCYVYEDVISIVAPALTAVIDEPGFPKVPDWNARLWGCALLLAMFPDWIRETPEQVRELLERILRDAIADARLTPESAYIALAQEKHRLRERGLELSRLANGS